MADKTIGDLAEAPIGELPPAPDIYDDTLIPVEQQGEARHISGRQWKQYAEAAVNADVQRAEDAADAAEGSADAAAKSADKAEKVSMHPPTLKEGNDHWWVWDAEKGAYKDSGVDAGVSLEVIPETITGEPGSAAKVENLGTKTDPVLQFTLPRGKDGSDGEPGFSPTVDVQKEGKTTTVTITDESGPHVAKILDGKDGAGAVESVNSKTGVVELTAEDVGAYTKAEVDAKAVRFTVTLPAASWTGSSARIVIKDANFLSDDKYLYIVDCGGHSLYADDVTANGEMTFHSKSGQVPYEDIELTIIRMEVE